PRRRPRRRAAHHERGRAAGGVGAEYRQATSRDLRDPRSRRPLLRGRACARRVPRRPADCLRSAGRRRGPAPDHRRSHGDLGLLVRRAGLAVPAGPALTNSQKFDLEGHPLLFRTIGGADGVLATIVHVPDLRAICSGDIAYNNIHMWLRNSTPESREAWLASLDTVAALKPSTIITGHRDPAARDDNATRVLDQSRRYIEDFDQTVARSSTPLEVIDVMLAKYPAYGNRYTLFAAAVTQFPS